MFEIKVPTKCTTERVCTTLAQVVQRAYYIKPSLRFEVTPECITENGLINTVMVFDEDAPAGSVCYQRGESDAFVFCIKSKHVRKSRKPKDTIRTKSADSAVRTIVEVCKSEFIDEDFGKSVWDCVGHMVNSLEFHSRQEVLRSSLPSQALRLVKLLDCLLAIDKKQSLPHWALGIFDKPSVVEKIVSASIMDSIESEYDYKNCWCVHEFRGVFMVVSSVEVSSAGDVKYTVETFTGRDSLPAMLQDKIGMLSFVGNSQPIRNVGFKYDSKSFRHDDSTIDAVRYFISKSPDYIQE